MANLGIKGKFHESTNVATLLFLVNLILFYVFSVTILRLYLYCFATQQSGMIFKTIHRYILIFNFRELRKAINYLIIKYLNETRY